MAVIFNEAKLAKAIHEEANARAGCADHFRKCFLADPGDNRFGDAFFAELRQ
jgi:hypothetical protein